MITNELASGTHTSILINVFDVKAIILYRKYAVQFILQYTWLGTTNSCTAYHVLTGHVQYMIRTLSAVIKTSGVQSVHPVIMDSQSHVLY
jgi:hypothetical protein